MIDIEYITKVVKEFFETKPVDKVWLFGSYARGDQSSDSDIDLLIRFKEGQIPSLLKYAGMVIELEELFNLHVDLVKDDTVYPEIAPFIEKDKVLIYERNN